MRIAYNQTEERVAEVMAALPGSPLNAEVLEQYQRSMELLQPAIIDSVIRELEIYRNFPKRGTYEGEFNPREPRTCFMGHGFLANGPGTDTELDLYRKTVGRFQHPTWGHVTMLECWGGVHFQDYPEMVRAAYDYGWGQLDELPEITCPLPILAWMPEQEKGLSSTIEDSRNALIATAWEMGAKRKTIEGVLAKFDEEQQTAES